MSKPEPAIHIFSGEATLNSTDHAILPEAVWHSPAKRGDLLRAATPGSIILYFDAASGRLQPSHKEIQAVLGKGIRVIGAARQGALRGIELAGFGMEALGRVPYLLKNELQEREDAVIPTPIQPKTPSLCLVHLAHHAERVRTINLVDEKTCQQILALAAHIPAMNRDWPALEHRLRNAGIKSDQLERFIASLFSDPVDICRQDALSALRQLRTQPHTTPKPPLKQRAPSTLFFCPTERSARGSWRDGFFLRDDQVLGTFRLFGSKAKEVHRETIQRLLLIEKAREKAGPISYEEAGAHLLRQENILPHGVEQWCQERGLRPDEWQLLARDEAYLARFNPSSKRLSSGRRTSLAYEALNDFFRKNGLIDDESWMIEPLPGTAENGEPCIETLSSAWLRFRRYLDPVECTMRILKYRGLYPKAAECWADTLRFNRELTSQNPDLQFSTISSVAIKQFFLDLWEIPVTEFLLELRLRGFRGEEDFLKVARKHYVFALQVQRLGGRLSV